MAMRDLVSSVYALIGNMLGAQLCGCLYKHCGITLSDTSCVSLFSCKLPSFILEYPANDSIRAVYQGNVWDAKKFPFLSQMLFTSNSTSQKYAMYNQSEIMNSEYVVDMDLVDAKGLPYFATTFVTYILSTNLAM
jgi:hypothetical protein